ncbi:MAG: class I SAM-dependent methyltransferase [Myxococcales bacterium]|nr:class I SAM-dependent methyltransferase [Myxococcales bacterium]
MTVDASFWNRLAEDYSKKPVDRPEAFERKIAITRECMAPDHAVLGIGCGTGSLLLRLADAGEQLHGLDVSSEMVRIARDKARAQGVDNVTFHVGPFDDTFDVFEPGSLDGICAFSILHLLEDREASLARIFRMLKPGGFFVSSTVVLGESWTPFAPILWAMRLIGKAPMVKIFRTHTLLDEMRQTGFVDLQQPDVGAQSTVAFVVARKPA